MDYSDSAMIALVPSEADAERLSVQGYEPMSQLHTTLVFLGKENGLDDWTALEAGCRRLAANCPPLELKTWAVSHFNPTGENPCAVYLVGQGEKDNGSHLEQMQTDALDLAVNEVPNLPEQHTPWIPHMTIGYGLDPNTLTHGGAPVTFDRLRLAVGQHDVYIPLEGGKNPEAVAASGAIGVDVDTRLDRLEVVVGSEITGRLRQAWDELLHPRGRDGRFIEKNGYIHGNVTPSGGGDPVNANRARVVKFIPNPRDAGDPIVEVDLGGGKRGRALASTIERTAGPKASLNGPNLPNKAGTDLPDDEGLDVITPDQIEALFMDTSTPAVVVDNVDDALRELAAGNKVDLQQPEDVSILLDRMVEIVNEAKASGDTAPDYNLCDVTVEGASLFCAEHKGIPRVQMPQLTGKPLPGSKADALKDENGSVDLNADFRKMLEDRGVSVRDDRKPANYLKASQNELNGSKVAGMASAIESGKFNPDGDGTRLFVSNDNYIVDGHHRWAALTATGIDNGEDAPEMDVAVVDMSILELLAEANKFAKDMGLPQASASNRDPVNINQDAPNVDVDVDAVDAPVVKAPKVYDKTADDYGFEYHPEYEKLPELAEARAWEGWDSLPEEEIDPKDLKFVENAFASSSVDKVVNGDEPLREGYVAKVLRLDNGDLVMADGHHRAIMASEMGQPLKAHVVDAKDLPDDVPDEELPTNEPDVRPVSDALQLSQYADSPYAQRVNSLMATAEKIEPKTTSDLEKIAADNGGQMIGLDFKFKKPDGVAEKIERKVIEKNVRPEDVQINDALRYTMEFPPDQYVDGVKNAIESMRAAGYKMPDEAIENSWGQHDGYNGINATFQEPSTGAIVELQFHTPESFVIKDKGTHNDYEIVRNFDNPEPARRSAYDRMVDISDNQEFPTGDLSSIGIPKRRDFIPNPNVEPEKDSQAKLLDRVTEGP